MKKLIVAVLSCAVLAGCNADENRVVVEAQSDQGRDFHFMHIDEEGVTDITVMMAWPSDWAHQADKNPAAPYVARQVILSGGTEALKPQDVLQKFNEWNAFGELTVTPDYTYGELSFPIDHIEKVVPIAAEMLANPQIDPAWVERVKLGVRSGQAEAQAVTATQMWNAARVAVLGQQPIQDFLTLADLEAIDAVTEADLRAFHQETFVQTGVRIVVTGAISMAQAGEVVDDLLSGLPVGTEVARPRVDVDYSRGPIFVHLPEAEKTTLGFVGPLPSTTIAGDHLDLLALAYFGQGASGPLFDAVRTELRASYGFQAGPTNYDRAERILFITGEVEEAKLSAAVELIAKTYDGFVADPDLEGFETLRDAYAEGTTKNVEYVNVAARVILERVLDGHDAGDAIKLGEAFEAVTVDDIAARMAAYFPASDDMQVVAAGPNPDALPGACVISDWREAKSCP